MSKKESFSEQTKLIKNYDLSIWEMADIEYMKYTFIDHNQLIEDDSQHEDTADLFQYIDSIGQISFVNECDEEAFDTKSSLVIPT